MKITKYEHAALVIEEAGKLLVVDPGIVSKLPKLDNVQVVFITHIHGDHLVVGNIEKILRSNPDLAIVGSQEVLDELKDLGAKKIAVNAGDKLNLSIFEILVGGDNHAVIYQTSPCLNRSLVVNGKFYYSGDSFDLPTVGAESIELVAVPASAPWMKISEAMEFIKKLKVKRVFPTHNALLSEFGEKAEYNWLKKAADEAGTELLVLKPGESTEV
jgi:L-ascorbate metabolism protein UlaG (beta-lactamase superfamily)